MKKQICAVAIASAISMPVMADFLGVYAGIDYRTTTTSYSSIDSDFEDTNNLSGYIALEHFIPLIPNVKLKYSDLSTTSAMGGNEPSSSAVNGILYYQLFDNGLFEFDFGLAYTAVEDIKSQSADLGQAYGAAKIHVPGTGMHAFAELIGGSVTDDNATDAELGLAYTFNPDSIIMNFSVRAGYRYQEMKINDRTQENKGLFAGIEAHF
ncbi:TIGR04219 family outer membrane beta-barrel protein [Psychromonas hadalis]|uniref:TIGR04219 family outer membrane beta-barrel protein n=1 Tax=Psychromonas hadalis TaxID=211669 RepID=UPI0003B689D7|nr:TIGR04219 family outer membrane beta-barrel protein [Psychromonas hadalis]